MSDVIKTFFTMVMKCKFEYAAYAYVSISSVFMNRVLILLCFLVGVRCRNKRKIDWS